MIIDGIDYFQQMVRVGFQYQQFDLLVVKFRVEFVYYVQMDLVFCLGIDGVGYGFVGIMNIIVQQIGDFDDFYRYIL